METKMQKVVNTIVIMLERDSKEYKQVMTEYLKIKTDKLGQEKAKFFTNKQNIIDAKYYLYNPN